MPKPDGSMTALFVSQVQSSLVMAILSSVVAGIGIRIIWSNLKQTSSIFHKCQNQQIEEFCFAVTFLTVSDSH